MISCDYKHNRGRAGRKLRKRMQPLSSGNEQSIIINCSIPELACSKIFSRKKKRGRTSLIRQDETNYFIILARFFFGRLLIWAAAIRDQILIIFL